MTYDRRASTTPLPARFPKDEMGLMTQEEFLDFRNPQGKMHPSSAYDFDIMKLNRDRGYFVGSIGSRGDRRIEAYKYPHGFKLVVDDKPIAVLHQGIAYYESTRWANLIPPHVYSERRSDEKIEMPFTRTKLVKYLSEIMPLISPNAALNRNEYPVVLKHLIIDGEQLTVRAQRTPEENEGVNLAILNPDGYIVAVAQDEWGTTLLSVAQEYRGKGLGKVIGKIWYQYNPGFGSGGFTESGKRNAIELWKDRVREFMSNGWYSELVKQKRMTAARVNDILQGVGERFKREPVQDTTVKATGDLLCYCDGISFTLYDRAFLQEQENRFIYGFGFLRDADPVGTFVFRIEYERKYANLATKIVLQMARDNGERLYDGEGYRDLLEGVDVIPGVVRDGDYIEVTQDLVPLKQWARLEKTMRGKVDPYREIYNSLVEQAESKWN